MGHFTDNLYKKNKKPKYVPEEDQDEGIVIGFDPESRVKITECAIYRGGELHRGFKTHVDLRRQLGDTNPYLNRLSDTCGFMTSDDRFVSRFEASDIAYKAGQTTVRGRELLSSDIHKW